MQAFELMCVGEWSDTLLELELLTRIARLALVQGNYHLVGVIVYQFDGYLLSLSLSLCV